MEKTNILLGQHEVINLPASGAALMVYNVEGVKHRLALLLAQSLLHVCSLLKLKSLVSVTHLQFGLFIFKILHTVALNV